MGQETAVLEKHKKCRENKKKRTLNSIAKFAASSTLEIDQFRRKETEVATPRTLWARKGAATSCLTAPASDITSLKKYETTLFEIGREGERGDTNKEEVLTTKELVRRR